MTFQQALILKESMPEYKDMQKCIKRSKINNKDTYYVDYIKYDNNQILNKNTKIQYKLTQALSKKV